MSTSDTPFFDSEATRADRAEAERDGLFAALQIANREIDDRKAQQKEAEAERDNLRAQVETLQNEAVAWSCTVDARGAERDALLADLQWLEDEAPHLSHNAWTGTAYMSGNRWAIEIRKDRKRELVCGKTLIETIEKARAALNQTTNTNDQ